MLLNVTNKLTFKRGLIFERMSCFNPSDRESKGLHIDTYRISDDLFTKKAMNWRKTICPEGLSVPLLLPDCNNRYYSKYCLFHLRSCF